MVPPSPPPSVVILFFSTFDTAVLACAGNSEFSRKFPWRLVYIFFQGEARGKKKDTGLPNQVRFAVNTLEPRVPALARRSWLGSPPPSEADALTPTYGGENGLHTENYAVLHHLLENYA